MGEPPQTHLTYGSTTSKRHSYANVLCILMLNKVVQRYTNVLTIYMYNKITKFFHLD